MVLFPGQIHISRRLRRYIRCAEMTASADTQFERVIQSCAEVRRKSEEGTWILPEMIDAYVTLHHLGLAHSIEITKNGILVGGLYGVSLGGIFYGESMFSLEPNASKIAMIALARQCERWDIGMIDCQMWTEHLASMGASLLSRASFMRMLRKELKKKSLEGTWTLDTDILCFDGVLR